MSVALGIALIGSKERCIAAFSIKANLLREGGVQGEKGVRESSGSLRRLKERSIAPSLLQQQIPLSISSHIHTHRVITTLCACHDKAWVQSVTLSLLVPLPRLVHMCSHTLDLLVAKTDSGFYANSIVLNGLGG